MKHFKGKTWITT